MPGPRAEAAYTVDVDQRLTLVIGTVGALGVVVHVLLVPFFAWLGIGWLALLNVGSVAAWIAGWELNRRGNHPAAVTLMTGEVMLHSLAAVSALGFQAGFQYYLIGGIPFTLFNTRWRTPQIMAVAALMAGLFLTLYLTVPPVRFVFPEPAVVRTLHVANAVITFMAIVLATYYFRVTTLLAEAELEARATTDPLTGIYNRRRMVELLEQERARSERTGEPFAVVLTDVDHFKGFNDRHGHECGDQALVTVAEVLSGRLRKTDHLARWGGEEFLALLPATPAEGAQRIAEALRQAIESRGFRFAGCDLRLTMTFGVATGDGDQPVDAVIGRADAALYGGKEGGRNRVMVDEEEAGRSSP